MTHARDENTQALEDDRDDFLDLAGRLAPSSRKLLNLLLRKVADLEKTEGERAALTLIDDIFSIVSRPLTTH